MILFYIYTFLYLKLSSLRGNALEKALDLAISSGGGGFMGTLAFLEFSAARFNRAGRQFPMRVVDEKWSTVMHAMFFPRGSYLVQRKTFLL